MSLGNYNSYQEIQVFRNAFKKSRSFQDSWQEIQEAKIFSMKFKNFQETKHWVTVVRVRSPDMFEFCWWKVAFLGITNITSLIYFVLFDI